MNYIYKINHFLKPSVNQANLVIDIFAGCGGLSLGFEAQGFTTHGFEMNADC
ncbi:MAG: DNA (cytosine-5-)-methyltransferase, partial [Trichodesmium sp. St2_bin6]|nr:DNA (cytosine-5-)-methyltransferase [Trichodesmium sp. St2_bin6]